MDAGPCCAKMELAEHDSYKMLWEKERFRGPTDLTKSVCYLSALEIHKALLANKQINISNKKKNYEEFFWYRKILNLIYVMKHFLSRSDHRKLF